jgi:transketolase
VVCRTDPCRGLDLLRRRAPRLHYLRFKTDQERDDYEQALAELEERQ